LINKKQTRSYLPHVRAWLSYKSIYCIPV